MRDASQRVTDSLAAPLDGVSRVGAIAAAQHGVFTRRQALATGISRAAVDDRIRRGIWSCVDYGVYRAAETPTSWLQRLLAACLAGPAVASHRSAAALWNFPGFVPGLVEVTALRHRRRKASDVVWHESKILDEQQITTIELVPVTLPVRTLLDMASVVELSQLLIAFDDAERRHLLTRARFSEELERLGDRRPGTATARALLKRRPLHEPVRGSALESMFDNLIEAFGLPKPQAQYTICDEAGSFVARVDFAFVENRLAVEIDGARFHAGSQNWEHDLARQNEVEKRKWRVLRFTFRALRDDPARIAATIREALTA